MDNRDIIDALKSVLNEMYFRDCGAHFCENIPEEKITEYAEELSTMIAEIDKYNNELIEIRERALKEQGKRFIKYRPHRGLLADAMAEYREFFSLSEMYDHIVRTNTFHGMKMFEENDIVVSEPIGEDDRIGWKDNRYICVKRYGNEEYDIPQCIGMCSYDNWNKEG